MGKSMVSCKFSLKPIHWIVVHQIFFDLPLAQNFWTTYSINRHCSAGFHSTRTWLERSMSFAQKSRYTRRVKAPGNERPNLGTSFPWESIFLGDCSLPGWQERVESRLGAEKSAGLIEWITEFVVPIPLKFDLHTRAHTRVESIMGAQKL